MTNNASEQISTDEAAKVNAPVIAASEKNCMGFKNRTNDPADEIVADLVSGKVKGVLILDPEKVGEVAVRVAQQVAPIRKTKERSPKLRGTYSKSQRPAHNARIANATAHKTTQFQQP